MEQRAPIEAEGDVERRLRQEAADLRAEVARLRRALVEAGSGDAAMRQVQAAAQHAKRPWRGGGGPTAGEARSQGLQAVDLTLRSSGVTLVRNEERLRAIVESSVEHAIITADLEDRITAWNRGAREVLGWSEADAIGWPNSILYTPEDHMAGVPEAELAEALTEGHAEHDRWHLRADGSRIWGTEVVTPLQNGTGETRGFLKILRDRTVEKREEERRNLLLAELNHRVKNTLAIVQSLVSQTVQGTESVTVLRMALETRLEALASLYDLLTREGWQSAGLADVVRATLAPYDGSTRHIRVCGPALRLMPNAALVLSMALHELATNAAKYGALSIADGALEVTWRVDRAAESLGGATLDLLWRERGGPPVTPPPARGFGSALIEDSVTYQLGGAARLAFEAEGVACRFRLPLTNKLEYV